MIKIKISGKDTIRVCYSSKHTCTLENLLVINEVCDAILENDEEMTLNDIFKEIKRIRKEIKEND